jgi:4-amino-4-deoxy-L-arabinose transferase-like glycosyltransferase
VNQVQLRATTQAPTEGRPRYGPITSGPVLAVLAAAVGVGTLAIRIALHGAAFDLFGDEVIYTDLGRSVINGGFPRFFGIVFFLHGPAFFYLESGWSWLAGKPASLMAWVYEMRMLNAMLAGATAVVLVQLTARVSSLRAGLLAGALFALDPFCVRQNDRVLLETSMMFWVLLGYLVLVSLIRRPTSAWARTRAVGAGLLFGIAVLTKDEAALVTVLPMAAAAVLRWGPSRWLIALIVGATALPYAVYVSVVPANGYTPWWWSAKTSGIERLLGVIQTTGFHRSGSLGSRLIAEGGNFWTTYALLALAVPAAWLVLRRGGPMARIMGLLYCASGVTLAYAVTLGTLEEQELYLLVVPSFIMISVGFTLRHKASHARPRSAARAFIVVKTAAIMTTLAVVFGLNVKTGVQWLRQPDDGFAHLLPYLAEYVPPGMAVDTPAARLPLSQSDGGRYELEGQYRTGLWTTQSSLRKDHVRYILVEWGPIDEGLSYLDQAQVRALIGHSRLLFSYTGRSYGQLALYEMPGTTDRSAEGTHLTR